jgi:REP element-mobilizing transposase RayT
VSIILLKQYEDGVFMPRTARIKTETGIYHIMMRSVSDFRLFRNDSDKNKFLQLLRKYKETFLFKIYSYCIMDTHVHLLVNSNGADVSKFMHNINQCYAQYYNNKYNRTGHVFGDRFKSTVATNDLSILCMSAYIHNNPKDMKGYRSCVENYKYSSFNIYLGKCEDKYRLIDKSFILNYFHKDPIMATRRYFQFVRSRIDSKLNNIDDFPYMAEASKLYSNLNSDKSIDTKPIIRNATPNNIIKYVAKYTNFNISNIDLKFKRTNVEFRAICVFLMRMFCNYNYSQIRNVFGNISMSSISSLYNKGYFLIQDNHHYKDILSDFLNSYSSDIQTS